MFSNDLNTWFALLLNILSVPRNLAVVEGSYQLLRGGGGAVLAAYVSVGTSSLECSVLECGQVYNTLCCLLYITFANITRTYIQIHSYKYTYVLIFVIMWLFVQF
jgi:hypothetical protein